MNTTTDRDDAVWRETVANTLRQAIDSLDISHPTSERSQALWSIARLWNRIPADDEAWDITNQVLILREELEDRLHD